MHWFRFVLVAYFLLRFLQDAFGYGGLGDPPEDPLGMITCVVLLVGVVVYCS